MSTYRDFRAKVYVEDGAPRTVGQPCWVWLGQRDAQGYGTFNHDGKKVRAHRYAYEHHRGEIPAGLEPDHLCKRPECVNPNHLELVSHRENVLRSSNHVAQQAKQTACKRGHPFTPENTRIKKGNKRECRTCHRERERERSYRRKHDP